MLFRSADTTINNAISVVSANVVSVESHVNTVSAQLASVDTKLSNAISAEVANRQSAVASLSATLQAAINTASNNLSNEISNRQSADTALSAVLQSAINTVSNAVSVVSVAVTTKVSKSGDTMTGYLNLFSAPTSDYHAATKRYVDDVAQGLHVHIPVEVATTDSLANLTSGSVTYANGTSGVGATLTLGTALTSCDGYTLQNTNRILVKNESTTAYNGIYTWATGGTVLTKIGRAHV